MSREKYGVLSYEVLLSVAETFCFLPALFFASSGSNQHFKNKFAGTKEEFFLFHLARTGPQLVFIFLRFKEQPYDF